MNIRRLLLLLFRRSRGIAAVGCEIPIMGRKQKNLMLMKVLKSIGAIDGSSDNLQEEVLCFFKGEREHFCFSYL